VLFAGGVHAAKATARPVVNVTTAGIGAPLVSTAEDTGAVAMTVAAIALPILVVFFLAAFAAVLWWLWRRERRRRGERAAR
jgi:Flp pilus assembly protein TadB